MATSNSFANPITSFSTIELSLNSYLDDENPTGTSPSPTGSASKRDRNRFIIPLQTITTDNITTDANDENKSFEDEQLLTSHYDDNRLKQERLLIITNVFRLIVICIVAPIIYFLV